MLRQAASSYRPCFGLHGPVCDSAPLITATVARRDFGPAPVAFCRISGKLNAYSCEELEAFLARVPASQSDVSLDLMDVEFIDASCLAVIAEFGNTLERRGCSLIVKARNRLEDRFTSCGLDRYTSTERAVA